jgi:hypothetical protein
MRDIRTGRVGGARTAVAALAMLTAVAPPLVAVAPASAAPVAGAIAPEAGIDDAGLSVSAAMTVGSDDPRAGDEVTVEITLTNTGLRALPVSVDEVFGDVVDDAVLQAGPRSSDPELILLRLGHDRVAIMGELGAGERATVGYSVVVGPVDDRGDGVLRRVLVPADADVTCDDGAAASESVPSESAVLGACTESALVDGPRPSAASSERVAGVAGTGAAGGTPGSGAVEGTVTADGAPAADGEGSVAGSQPLVLVAATALSLLLLCVALAVALIRRSRASRVSRRRASSRRASTRRVPAIRVPAVRVTPVRMTTAATSAAPARRAAPIDPGRRAAPAAVAAPHFDSRRERRLAERRLVERGLALPVA